MIMSIVESAANHFFHAHFFLRTQRRNHRLISNLIDYCISQAKNSKSLISLGSETEMRTMINFSGGLPAIHKYHLPTCTCEHRTKAIKLLCSKQINHFNQKMKEIPNKISNEPELQTIQISIWSYHREFTQIESIKSQFFCIPFTVYKSHFN